MIVSRFLQRFSIALYCCLVLLFPCSTALAQDSLKQHSVEEIKKVIQIFFEGMRARDTAAVRSLFAPDSRLSSVMNRSGQPVLRSITVDQFNQSIAKAKETLNERMSDIQVQVAGDIATAWGEYEFHVGSQLTHRGIDSFQFAKTADGWKIVQINYSVIIEK